MDLINDAPIVSLNGDEFVGVEGEDYVNRVISKLGMDKSSVQNLYYHYMGGNEIMKSSILAVPIVIEKGVIIQHWRKGHNKNLKTGVTAAPISIGGIRYICCVVNTKNAQKKISPYSIRLFDNTQIRDMLQSNIVHHSTTSTSQPSDTSNANPLTVAMVLQKYLLANNSQEKDVDDNEDNNSTDTTNENKQYNKNRNMKRTVRLRESELRHMISESVKKVLNEEHGGTYIQGVLQAIEDAIYSTVDTKIARMAIGDRLNMMKQTLARFVKDTFEDACVLERNRDAIKPTIIDNPPSGTFW